MIVGGQPRAFKLHRIARLLAVGQQIDAVNSLVLTAFDTRRHRVENVRSNAGDNASRILRRGRTGDVAHASAGGTGSLTHLTGLHLRRPRDAGQFRTTHFVGNALLFGALTTDTLFAFGFLAFFLFFETLFLCQARFFRLSGFFGFASFFRLSSLFGFAGFLGLALLFQAPLFFEAFLLFGQPLFFFNAFAFFFEFLALFCQSLLFG